MPVEERKPLSVMSKICYGLGGLATEIYWSVLGAYTNIFLVEIAQLPPLFGTSVVFGGRAMDAICNFILGPLIDRTETRWGKLKPWILGAGLLVAPVYILLWYVPDVGSEGKLVWYIVLSIILMFAKTALNVSSRTYVMFLSPDSLERDSATAYRGIFSFVGITAAVAIHGQIVGAYSQAQIDPCAISNDTGTTNGTNGTMDNAFLAEVKTGYLVSAGVVSVIVVACVIAVVFGTTELRDISKTSRQQRNQSLVKMLRAVWTFRPNVIMLMIFFCVQMILFVLLGAAVLYVQYGMDLPDQIHNSMLAFAVSAVISVPVIGKIVARFGKRITFMCCQLALIPTSLALQFLPSRSAVAVLIICVLLGMSGSAGLFVPWTMLSDVIDDYSLRTGRRLDTWFFSMALSVLSLTATVGLGLTTITLEIGGYKAGACFQPESVGTSLRMLVSIVPAAFALICVGLIWKYPITEERRRDIKEELENRQV
ncbi:sodium-dependent lysophosphatidylcholine symporter 1-like [Branchiostoma lanceolatum]|uniref:sodium-dependent lysophosphatidylcholine symporter 1-like n=1 Tax=Branchiostoma lanceolatum TaxID=7740 RepID=UPI00345127ED